MADENSSCVKALPAHLGQPSPNLFSLKDHTQECLASSALELGVETFVPDQAELKAVSFRRRLGPWQSLALREGAAAAARRRPAWAWRLEPGARAPADPAPHVSSGESLRLPTHLGDKIRTEPSITSVWVVWGNSMVVEIFLC